MGSGPLSAHAFRSRDMKIADTPIPLAALLSLALLPSNAACRADTATPIAPPGSSTPVDRLSQLGIFEGDVAKQTPRSDFVPYDVNVALYADGASKLRFLYVPPGTHLGATDDRWEVPIGAYFVKTFFYPLDARSPEAGRRLIETRFLVRNAGGYTVSTYLWNDEQTDAFASPGNVDVPITWIDEGGVAHVGHFHVPGTSQCQSCHSERALGLRTRQMDRAATFPDGTANQIDHLVRLGTLDAVPSQRLPLVDPLGSGSLDDRARSYLDANCAHCHGAGGSAARTNFSLDREDTDAPHLPLCRSTASVGGNDHVIVPGRPSESALLARMTSTDPFVRMPRGPTHVPDGAGIAVLWTWIAAMSPAGCR